MKVLACALLFALPAAVALGLPPESDTWTVVESAHLRVVTDGSVERARTAAEGFEDLYEALTRLGGEGSLTVLGRGTLVVFRDSASAAPYWQPGLDVLKPGFVALGGDSSVAVLAGTATGVDRLVAKQFLMRVLQHESPSLPLWLRYGLAEYLATFEREGTRALIGRRDVQFFLSMGVRDERFPWPRVFATTALPDDVHERLALLGKATLLVHYALAQPLEDRRRFAEFVRRTGGGEEPETAWRACFGTELASFGPAADAYLEAGELRMLRFELPARSATAFTTRPLPRTETLALLGDLLTRLGPTRRAAALDHFVAVSELAPADGALWRHRAELHEQLGQGDAARAAWARAAELLPEDLDVLARWSLGELESLTRGGKLDQAGRAALVPLRAALAKITAARPDDVDTWSALAAAWSYEPVPPEEAVAAFTRAYELAPERVDFGYNALLGHVRRGDAAGAELLLTRLEAKPASAEILDRARNALASLDLKEALRLARNGKAPEAAGLYAKVLARATDPALVKPAANGLAQATKTAKERAFYAAYQAVVKRLEGGDLAGAKETLEELAATAETGAQKSAVAALRGRVGG
ncbi:MAG: hypothetical protein SF066_17035 [Thermoanaerobaculia bacterium]|nr:hypothetical protein [Thermoanaerobaculia bacterium]